MENKGIEKIADTRENIRQIDWNKARYNIYIQSFIMGYKKAMEIGLSAELQRIMQDDPVLFFLINMKNYLTPKQLKIVSDRLVELTTKSNGEVLQDAIKKTWDKIHYMKNKNK